VGDQTRRGEIRITTAMLWLAQDDPHAATAALAPVLDGSAPMVWPSRLTQAFLLAASAGGTLGDEGAAERPWSARWTGPSPTARCCGSCCTW